MLTGSFFTLATLALATVASAKPIPSFKIALAKRGRHPSFNSALNLPGMSHFDDFYGVDNFAGISQTVVKEKTVVCHTQTIEVVQQYLAVIREYYKRIITQQVCEVETQTVLHQQFFSGCSSFFDDLRHVSSRDVTFDQSIATQITSIHDSHGESVMKDLGWNGLNIGSHSVSIQGSNWNDDSSYMSVNQAYGQVQLSHGYCISQPPPSISSSSCDSCDESTPPPPPMISSSSDCESDSCDSSSTPPPPPSSDCESDSCDSSSTLPPPPTSSDSAPSGSSNSTSGLSLAPSNSTDGSVSLSSKKRALRSRARMITRK